MPSEQRPAKPPRLADIQITLVLGFEGGFDDATLEFFSDQNNDSCESPEEYLLRIEEMLNTGELTLEEVKQFIEDKSK